MDLQVDPSDEDVIIAYSMEWMKEEKGPGGGMNNVIYRQLIVEVGGMWVIADFKAIDRRDRKWEIKGGPWAWPWKWCPIVSGPNIEAPWGWLGYSDLEDITGLNSGINTAISNYGKILRFHAHPKTVGIGFEAKDIQATDIGSLWTVRNQEASVKNLEMQTDLRSSLAFINTLTGSFWNIGRGLDPTVYQQNVTNVTNFGLRVMSLRSLEKMEDKRGTYGRMLRELVVRCLDVVKIIVDAVKIEWPDPLPTNPTAVVDKLEKEVGMGIVSRETAAGDLGRTWKLEHERIMEEAKDQQTLGEMFMEAFDKGETGGNSGSKSTSGQT